MIDRSGRLKILDFGIARMLGVASNTSVMIGTPGYMAPEQITGDPVDHRSDQFAIGVVFYELLSYTEPFPGDTLPAITHRILNDQPKPLLGMVPEVTPEVAAIVDQALKKAVAERFPDTDAMRSAISRVRRQFNSDDSWSGATIPMGRDITPPAATNRGTGSARQRTGNAIGVAQLTPPPDPRRTDREALARRRTAQLEAALAQARQLVAEQQLEAALDACQQALTFDENHAGALELEAEIETALGLRDGTTPEDLDVTVASEPGAADPRLIESQAVTREGLAFAGGLPSSVPTGRAPSGAPPDLGVGDRTVLRPVTPAPYQTRPQAPPPTNRVQDPPSAVSEPTIIAPSRRTPAPITQTAKPATIPPPVPPAAPTAPPPVAQQQAKSPIQKAPAQKVPVQKAPSGPDLVTRIKSAVGPAAESIVRSAQSIVPPGKTRMVAGTAAVVVVIAIAATAYFLTRGPLPTGTLVIEAAPWGTVTAIRAENGREQAVPPQASTPLSIALPEGTYQITVTGPDSKAATINAHVAVGGIAVAPMARFDAVTVEQYFEQYLGAPVAPTGSAAPAADAASPATPPATGGQ
jgi:hypothetical protein